MLNDLGRIYDGFNDMTGGMDAGRRASLIDPNQSEFLENIVCRGGSPTTRPAFAARPLNFTNTLYYDANGTYTTHPPPIIPGHYPFDSTSAFQQGLFQGAQYYDLSEESDSIIVSIGGRIFQIVPRVNTADVTELKLDRHNRENIPIAYTVQADRFCLIQDGESSCIIYDGVTARRAGKDEIPVGTIMAYGMGRIVLIGNNKRDIFFGDLFGSHQGDPSLSILKFTETQFLTGGAASIPFSLGHIRGAVFYPQQDTSMGQGQLLVFAEKGMSSFFLSLPREQWQTSGTFEVLGLIEIGGRGHRAFTPVNGDVWFRSGDGWRAYRQARAEAKGWFQLPLSTEVDDFVDSETQDLLVYGSSIRFDNRLITTCTPYPNQGRPYHNGLLALDFNVLSSFGESKRPAWDGHWHGLKVQQLVEGNFNGKKRAFIFALDDNGFNALYEISNSDVVDSTGPITSEITMREFDFQQPFNENKTYDADLWPDTVKTHTTLQVWYQPDGYPNFIPWRTGDTACQIDPLDVINNTTTIAGIPTVADGFFPRLSLGKPPPACDEFVTMRDTKRAYKVQVKLRWTGYMAINKFRMSAEGITEPTTSNKKPSLPAIGGGFGGPPAHS